MITMKPEGANQLNVMVDNDKNVLLEACAS